MEKKKLIVWGAAVLALAVLVNHYIIHNPMGTVIPADVDQYPEQISDAAKRLSDDEKGLLLQYLMRHGMAKVFGSTEAYHPVTIGEAIKEQKIRNGQDDAQEAKQQKLKGDVEKERAAKIAEVNKAITVSYLGKKLTQQGYQDFIELRVAYQNNTTKDILGIKGKLVFKDLFGDKILGVITSMDSTIKAGAKHVEENHGLNYNEFLDPQKRLVNTPDDKIKFEYIPQIILFTDGSKVEVSADDD